MNWKILRPILGSTILLAAVLACSIPGITTEPTPYYVFPTPNLTMTALFSQPMSIPPTATEGIALPLPPPTSVETSTPEPTLTYTPTAAPTITRTSTYAPTIIYVPVTATSPQGLVRSGASITAPYFSSPPAIDGVWSDSVWGLATGYGLNYVTFGSDNWTGPEDLNGGVKVGWDSNYLYVAFKVVDDVYVQNANGAMIYKGDSPEILLDANLQSDFYVDSLSNDDYQIVFSPGNPSVGTGLESFRGIPSGLGRSTPEVLLAAVATSDGYRLEAAIPWSTLGATPARRKHFGFAASVSDNDDTGDNLQQSMISNVAGRHYTIPTTWGDLYLGD